MRYWVYLGSRPDSGPFPTLQEATWERDFMRRHNRVGNPAIFQLSRDELDVTPEAEPYWVCLGDDWEYGLFARPFATYSQAYWKREALYQRSAAYPSTYKIRTRGFATA